MLLSNTSLVVYGTMCLIAVGVWLGIWLKLRNPGKKKEKR